MSSQRRLELPIDRSHRVPADELEVTFVRSGGPGGQNVNKVATCAVLRFDLHASRAFSPAEKQWIAGRLASRLTGRGELLIEAQIHRSAERNLAEARERLAELLGRALERPKPRVRTRPGRGAERRRLDAKRRRSERKQGRGSRDWSD